jgi:von Willebrand factor type A domain
MTPSAISSRGVAAIAFLLALAAHGLLLVALFCIPYKNDPSRTMAVDGVRLDSEMLTLDDRPSRRVRPADPVEQFVPVVLSTPAYPTTARENVTAPTVARGQTTAPNTASPGVGPNDGPESGTGEAGPGRRFFPEAGTGRSVVFVIDRSLSMGMYGALATARAAVLNALAQLPSGVRFQIVLYNRKADLLYLRGATTLTLLDEEVRRDVERALADLDAVGSTDHVEALRVGLRLRPDVLYLVTDAGDLRAAEADAVARLNTQLTQGRTCIHTIELSRRPEQPDNPLRRVAVLNHGTYRRLSPTTP